MKTVFGVKLIATEYHVSHEYLNLMRLEGDTLADNAVSYLFEKHGISNINRNFDRIIDDFIDSLLPNNLNDNILLTEPINFFQLQILTIPDWVDWNLVNKGQNLFLKHLSASSLGLLYFSLLGGFSAPKIVSVLDETGYLTKARDLTWKRLLETMQMVVSCVDINDYSMKPGNSGWKSVIKTRLLHARVRKNIKINDRFNVKENGIPINQEDMMGTLLSFSINIIETIEAVSGTISLDEKNAYLHLWRYIGFLIGVEDKYNPLTDLNIARGRIESIVDHILSPTERSKQVVEHVLLSVSNRDISMHKWDYKYHSQCTRMLLGDEMADALGINKFSLFHYLYITCFFLFIRIYKAVFIPCIRDNGRIIHWKYNMLKNKIEYLIKDISVQNQINLTIKKEN